MVWVTSQTSMASSCAVRDVEMSLDVQKKKKRRNWTDFPTRMLRWSIFMICFAAFLANSYHNMRKFKEGATTISEEWVWSRDRKLALPAITLCPMDAPKGEDENKGPQQIEEVVRCNSEDDEQGCVQSFNTPFNRKLPVSVNFSDHKVVHTLHRGKCFTKELPEIQSQQLMHLTVRDLPLKIYFHEPAEEFFHHLGWFPNGLPTFMTTGRQIEDLYTVELLKTQIEHKDNCQPWTLNEQIECLRSRLREEYLESGINCSLPWMEEMLLLNTTFPDDGRCPAENRGQLIELIFNTFLLDVAQTCQTPCTLVKYLKSVDNLQSRFGGSAMEGYNTIFLQYDTTATKVLTTVDLFSFSDFVSSIGGNLRLFLDFSLISLLFALLAKIKGRSLN